MPMLKPSGEYVLGNDLAGYVYRPQQLLLFLWRGVEPCRNVAARDEKCVAGRDTERRPKCR